MTSRTTRLTRHFDASPEQVYQALTDPNLVAAWRFPQGMTIEIVEYDLSVGGRFRISLTYQDPHARGKTTEHTDTHHGHFMVLEPNESVMQVIEFETDDPAMQGEMIVSFTLRPDAEGTVLHASHENVPPGVALDLNELGWTMSLDKLSVLLDGRPPS